MLELGCPAIGYCKGHYKASAAIQAALVPGLFKASAAVHLNVSLLLACMQTTNPNTINEDNSGASWGHYQYTSGVVTLETALTDWLSIGSVHARFICCEKNIDILIPMLTDSYLEKLVDKLTLLWQKASGNLCRAAISCSMAFIASSPALFIHSLQPLKLLTHRTTPLSSSLTFGSISLHPSSLTPSQAPSSPPEDEVEDEDLDDTAFRSLMQLLSVPQYHKIVKMQQLTGCPKSNANKPTWIDFFTCLPLADKCKVKCDATAMPKTGRGTTKKATIPGKKTVTPAAKKITSTSKLPIPRSKPCQIMPPKPSMLSSLLTNNNL
ncbi:hypothetical protein BDN71DRAFT_1432807 [Pleurotus eryngii]|uniref:Uncharacterized protein n=1 Tax=Pleurotus eryngii TaxID=5323 RepID=A0A9P5ZVA3_PLEER|nr:hypothetical protein BDN71DRAFT_1432807 [Pleurotus eryngii]